MRGVVLGRIALLVMLAALACGAEQGDGPPAAAPAPPQVAPATADVPDGLAGLRALVGKYPGDVGLFDREPLHGRLVTLLGDRYGAFLANMGTQGPISIEGDVLYVVGNKPHAGGDSAAILLVDLGRDLVHVRILDETEMAELRERDVEIPLPPEVATTIANWEELARDTE
jgi:hypothetical protein